MGATTDPGARRRRLLPALALGALVAAGAVAATTRVNLSGSWRGLYLLEQRSGRPLELKDDLFLGDGSRLVVGVSLAPLRRWLGMAPPGWTPGGPELALEWDEEEGRGLVRNRLADGTELVTVFGRYEDSEGGYPQGLFVGGAVPEVAADLEHQDQSGMAWRSARGWSHVWCNVNELVQAEGGRAVVPSTWRFLGSRILQRDRVRVVLGSGHEVELPGGRLRMDRFAYFTAGQHWFRLGVRLEALGPGPVRFVFAYGDEPWVGHFGSAAGNVGWAEGGIFRVETSLDLASHQWVGILDEPTGVANFIAWLGDERPLLAFVSNGPGELRPGRPLSSNEVFVGVEWPRRTLRPGESMTLLLAIGMAERDLATGRPRVPAAALRR